MACQRASYRGGRMDLQLAGGALPYDRSSSMLATMRSGLQWCGLMRAWKVQKIHHPPPRDGADVAELLGWESLQGKHPHMPHTELMQKEVREPPAYQVFAA